MACMAQVIMSLPIITLNASMSSAEPFQISAFLPDCHCAKELDVARVGMD